MKKLTLLIFLLTVACTSIAPKTSILNDSTCQAPCWNEITPGKTSKDEAIKNIKNISKNSIDIFSQPWKIFDEHIRFSFEANNALIQGEAYFVNKKVNTLILSGEMGLTVGELVSKIGEPESVISMLFDGAGTVLIAIYPSKGVKFEIFAKSENFQQETLIGNLMFFDTGYYQNLLEIGMFSMGTYNANETKKIMYPWDGYGNLDEKYPPRQP